MSHALVNIKKGRLKVVRKKKIKKSIGLECLLTGDKLMLENMRRQLMPQYQDCKVLLTKVEISESSSLSSNVQYEKQKSRYSLSPDDKLVNTKNESSLLDGDPLPHELDASDAFYIDIEDVRDPQVGVCPLEPKSGCCLETSSIEDPYENVELSEDEYVPENNDTLVSTDFECDDESLEEEVNELNNKETRTSQQNEKAIEPQRKVSEPPDEEDIEDNFLRIQSVSRRLFDSKDETQRNSTWLKESSERVRLATVELNGTIINMSLNNTVHKGIYAGIFFKATSIAGDNILQSYIFQKGPLEESHVCSTDCSDAKFVATLSRNEGSKRYKFESQYCFNANVFLSGNEVSFMKGAKNIACLEMVIKESCKNISSSLEPSGKVKRHCCLYCGKLKTCMSRHLVLQHKNEEDIKHIILLPPNSKKRNELLRKIRLEGDKNFNEKVDISKKIPVRRPVTNAMSQYQHCPACKALISKKNLARHYMKCTGKLLNRKKMVVDQNELTASQDYHARLLENILGHLKDDAIGQIIRGDRALKLLALYYALLHSKSSHQMTTCRAQLRRCGRLLTIVREMDSDVNDFADCLKVARYETLMNAIRCLCNLKDSDDSCFTEKPLLALQFGPIISQVVERLKVDLLKRGKDDDPEYAELVKFKQIHERDFRIEITRRALISAKINKFRNKPDLPTGDDVIRFTKYLQDAAIKSYTSLVTNGFSPEIWTNLAECVLCQILIFNRRRPGEASRIKLFDFNNRKQVTEDQYKHLTRLQIILAKYYSVIFIMAKGNRVVSVLLNPEQIKYLNLLNSMRDNMKIKPNNPFLFAYPNEHGHLNASVILTKLSNLSDVSNKKSIRATYLRKQVATMSQYLNLTDNEIQQLADFMGHTLEVHKQFYRTPESVNAITKLSRFFSVLGAHNLERYRGKSLEELEPDIPKENYDARDLIDCDLVEQIAETTETTQSADDLQDQELPETSNSLDIPEVLEADFLTEPGEIPNVSGSAAAVELPESQPILQQTPKCREVVKEQYSTPRKWKLRSRQVMKKQSPKKGPLIADIMRRINRQATPPRRRNRSNTKRWSRSEKAFMTEMFADYLTRCTLPSIEHCKEVLERNLHQFQEGRTPIILYSWIRNQIVKFKM